MFSIWWVCLILYIVLNVIFSLLYKVVTKKSKNDGALTVLLQLLSGIIILLFIPFFKMNFSNHIKPYLFLIIACVFYAINDRANTTARRGLDVSIFNILTQLSTVLLIAWGIIFFKEKVILQKILGAVLIIIGNVIVLFKKGKIQNKKYVLFAILANISFSIAVSVDVGISDQFNLPIYISITLILPALFIMILERVKFKSVIEEFKIGNKKIIIVISIIWAIMLISMLRAYQLASVTTVAPLCAVTTILNVFVSYIVLKEKDSMIKKIFAAILVVIGVVLIKI